MPKKKQEDTVEETANAISETLTPEIFFAESNADANEAVAAKTEAENTNVESADEALVEEPSIFESVIDTIASSFETVAETVADGVSAVVDVVTGAGGDVVKKEIHSKRAEKIGTVASDKMTNTVTVRVDRVVKHPMYRKYIKRRKKFMAHDEMGSAIGDKVRIVETRPLSAKKRWRVVEIIQKAER